MTGLFLEIESHLDDPEVEAVETAIAMLGEEYRYIPSSMNTKG